MKQDQNERLTATAAGTPMGELLRCHWQPIAGVDELNQRSTKAVRILGEDLTLYRDLSGNLGLIDRQCPHRRADMTFGYVEACGLRCSYHGWLFDRDGSILEQPWEETVNPNRREPVRIKAYPVREMAGLIWAYLGQGQPPELPCWEPFTWKNGFVQVVISHVPCNWLQAQENSIDPIHFEWMHANWTIRLRGEKGPYAPRHQKIDFREFDYGFTYNRIREDTDENNPLWTVGRVCLWPNAVFTGDHFEFRVPVDDENMLSIGWFFVRVPHEKEPFVQERIPTWYGPLKDEATGEWITSHVMNQDFIAWIGQGAIADRSKENLRSSDRGIGMLRRQLLRDLEAVARGEDPKGIIRDPERAKCVPLPVIDRKMVIDGIPLAEFITPKRRHMRKFIFQYGQPEHVRQAQEAALGVEVEIGSYLQIDEGGRMASGPSKTK
ncbi:aromatic ring-hydroxylating dioxygenase subunit alpha [Aurantiacibacter gilvus]|uniref:Aromatic ring-hydroxylating dioxygenase subunit alpha n=1 Tax=Aurantiacibacter gilvus TaxID=3139141 RepID=A0ABU9IHH5_9SPHN